MLTYFTVELAGWWKQVSIDMIETRNKIKRLFKVSRFTPKETSLVVWGGYDELEKKSAVDFFNGKDSGRLLADLKKGEACGLEEWSVLALPALTYYASAYFCYLLDSLESDVPDEEFVFYLLGALYQVVYMHKGSPFSAEQTGLIKELVALIEQEAKDDTRFEYYSADIQNSVKQFNIELNRNT